MENVIKQCIGIDVSQNVIDVTFGVYGLDQSVEFVASRSFKNVEKSFPLFLQWALKLSKTEIPLSFVMESTGVYHERLACFLFDNKQNVIVVLPSRASNFAKSLEVKTITDKEASKSLTRMGLEKKMELWVKPEPVYQVLKQLTREREQLQKAKTMNSNQVHAESKSAWPNEASLKRAKKRIKTLEAQIKEIEAEIRETIKDHPELDRKIQYMTSINGVGILTAATLVGETNGFAMIKHKRQLVSYAGYDVIRKDSGTSVHAKPRISKKGNRHIRKAMHCPALCSIKYNEKDKNHFSRMVQKHGIKMKGVVAIQRKVLILMYSLWKKEAFFDPNYINPQLKKEIGQLALP
jgi:transposase